MSPQVVAERAVPSAAAAFSSADAITSTALLIHDGTAIPETIALDLDQYCDGWSLVRGEGGNRLEEKLRAAGWQFFFLASPVAASEFGSHGPNAVRRALLRLMSQMRSKQYNCLEIEDVHTGRFFGIPYVRVTARPRHIQHGRNLAPQVRIHKRPVYTDSYI